MWRLKWHGVINELLVFISEEHSLIYCSNLSLQWQCILITRNTISSWGFLLAEVTMSPLNSWSLVFIRSSVDIFPSYVTTFLSYVTIFPSYVTRLKSVFLYYSKWVKGHLHAICQEHEVFFSEELLNSLINTTINTLDHSQKWLNYVQWCSCNISFAVLNNC